MISLSTTVEHLLSWIVQHALGDMARATSSLLPTNSIPQVCHGVMQGALLCWEEVILWCVIWGGKNPQSQKEFSKAGKVFTGS